MLVATFKDREWVARIMNGGGSAPPADLTELLPYADGSVAVGIVGCSFGRKR